MNVDSNLLTKTCTVSSKFVNRRLLGDLKARKSTGTSCRTEIHFLGQTSKFLIKYNLLQFQISGGLIIFFTEHDYKVSTSFIKENKRYK